MSTSDERIDALAWPGIGASPTEPPATADRARGSGAADAGVDAASHTRTAAMPHTQCATAPHARNAIAPPATAPTIHNDSRRAFLVGLGAGTLLLTLGVPLRAHAQDAAKKYGGAGMPGGLKDDPNLFVAIAPDGTVTVINHRAEMGQGVRTSVPMIVADELEAEWSRVVVQQALGNEDKYGNQNTDGSRSIRHSFMPLRRVGAAARQMLEAAAAAQWKVPASEVTARAHELVHEASNRRAGFGEFAAAAARLPVPAADTLRLKPQSAFRYIGRDDIALIDNHDVVTGKAQFGIDTRLPGMLYAVIARPPVYGGRIASHDASEAMQVDGVIKVVALDSPPPPSAFKPLGGIAVIARNTWAALEGRRKLRITWDDGPNGRYDSVAYRAELEASARKPGKVVRDHGDVTAALAGAAKKIEVEYYLPHLAHAPMEPPAAVVRASGDACEAWASIQAPESARTLLAELLGLDKAKVIVNQTLLGGGFGRKSKPDFIGEAALLSRAMDGAPVKVTWTREDDLMHDYFHTVALERIEAGIDADGKPVAWLHRTTAPSIGSLFGPDTKEQRPGELGQGLTDLAFSVPNLRIENPQAAAHTRIGWFRSVYNIPHAFATQCAAAELAHLAGRDAKDFLLELIGPPRQIDPAPLQASNYGEDPAKYPIDAARLRRVIETVADASGWSKPLPKGRGRGIAGHRSFASYTACVVEVEIGDDGVIHVPRVDIAIDCGLQINPERVRSQMEGSVVQGIGIALLGQVRFAEGRATDDNFHKHQLLRLPQAPRVIHVHAVAADDMSLPIGGVGEPGLPPVAPAVLNAIFAATGRRLRSLPVGLTLPPA